MKKFTLQIALLSFALVSISACSKDDDKKETSETSTVTTSTTSTTSTTNATGGYDLVYDGKSYKGDRSTFVLNPSSDPDFKNLLSVSNTDASFSVGIMNIPDSGTKNLIAGSYSADNGDCALNFKVNGEMVNGGLKGTIERISSKKVKVNALNGDKPLTGTIEWE